jgi:hypothetical protein
LQRKTGNDGGGDGSDGDGAAAQAVAVSHMLARTIENLSKKVSSLSSQQTNAACVPTRAKLSFFPPFLEFAGRFLLPDVFFAAIR